MTRGLTDLDRGAIAALDLLKRGAETSEGEESIEDTLETIRGAIRADGLPKIVRRQMDYERDFLASDDVDVDETYGPFPAVLKAIAKGQRRTKWRGGAPR